MKIYKQIILTAVLSIYCLFHAQAQTDTGNPINSEIGKETQNQSGKIADQNSLRDTIGSPNSKQKRAVRKANRAATKAPEVTSDGSVATVLMITLKQPSPPMGDTLVKGSRYPGANISVGASQHYFPKLAKSNANLTNLSGIIINTYLPITFDRVLTFGIHAGAQYSFSNKNPNPTLPVAFNVFGQSANTVAFKDVSNQINSSFNIFGGPQFNFSVTKFFSVSPILLAGYLSNKQNEITAIQTTTISGNNYNYILSSKAETKTSGLFVSPKLRFNYMLGGRIGLWLEGGYTMGPKVTNNVTIFTPKAIPAPGIQREFYELNQMEQGTFAQKEPATSTSFNAVNISGGLIVYFGKKGYQYYQTKSDMNSAGRVYYPNETEPQQAGNSASFTVVQTKSTTRTRPPEDQVPIDSAKVNYPNETEPQQAGNSASFTVVQTKSTTRTSSPENQVPIDSARVNYPYDTEPQQAGNSASFTVVQTKSTTRTSSPNQLPIDSAIAVSEQAIDTKITGGTKGKQTQGATFGERIKALNTENLSAISPKQNQKISHEEAKAGITFSWIPFTIEQNKINTTTEEKLKPTGINDNSTNSSVSTILEPETVTYRIRVWQLMQGQRGNMPMRQNQPVVTKEVDIAETIITNIPTEQEVPYLCDFVWIVEAMDKAGNILGASSENSFEILNLKK